MVLISFKHFLNRVAPEICLRVIFKTHSEVESSETVDSPTGPLDLLPRINSSCISEQQHLHPCVTDFQNGKL